MKQDGSLYVDQPVPSPVPLSTLTFSKSNLLFHPPPPPPSQHYLEHHLSQPLMRLFEPVMKNPKDLLTGERREGGGRQGGGQVGSWGRRGGSAA